MCAEVEAVVAVKSVWWVQIEMAVVFTVVGADVADVR